MPVDVRNLALAVIAVLLSLYMLHWAKAVVVPVLLGVMFSYALSPAIDRIERWRVPRAASAGLLLTAILAGLGTVGWAVSDDVDALIETLPEVAQKLRKALQKDGPEDQPVDAREGAAGGDRDRARHRGDGLADDGLRRRVGRGDRRLPGRGPGGPRRRPRPRHRPPGGSSRCRPPCRRRRPA